MQNIKAHGGILEITLYPRQRLATENILTDICRHWYLHSDDDNSEWHSEWQHYN